ncbi:MAG: type II toxin-antitoxin system death-on-curing family toxin [Elusimicrobia bacterium]|nr:type II toxin-antitoxin system death-on-curing family toxin [Elusimicrobiota bacterium]
MEAHKELRNHAALESALTRARMSAFGEEEYPTLFQKVAVMLHSLVQNHPFLDGNKRTAFGAMHLMLLMNGYDLSSSTNQDVAMVLRIATGKLGPDGIVSWVEKNIKKIK